MSEADRYGYKIERTSYKYYMANTKLRLGAFNVGEYTFWPYWADALSPRGSFGSALCDMAVTHCWDVDFQQAIAFAEKYGCEPVENYDGMLGHVDAIAFGGFYEVPWQHLLARPYIEAGIPTYLSRPFSYRLCDVDDLLERAARYNTPIMATNVYEHFVQATILQDRLANLGTIKSVYGVCTSGEYPAHFHAPFFLLKTLGYGVDKVSVLTDDEKNCSYLQETVLFKGEEGQPPFLASLHATTDTPYMYLRVVGDKGSDHIEMTRSPDPRETLYHFFAPQLLAMQQTFQGKLSEPLENIRSKTQLFLAGYYSHLECNGALVSLASVPYDWSPPHFKPGWIDASLFKE